MTPQNPAMHARSAADALDRLVRDVQTGRAAWSPHAARQAVDDLARITTAAATVLQQLAAAQGQQPGRPRTAQAQTVIALHQAGQYTTEAAAQLAKARHTMR